MMNDKEIREAINTLKEQYDYLYTNMCGNYPYTLDKIKQVTKCFEELYKEYAALIEENKKVQLEAQRYFDELCEGGWHDKEYQEFRQLKEKSRKYREENPHDDTISESEYKALLYAEKYGIIDYEVIGNKMVWVVDNLDVGYNCKGWRHIYDLENNKSEVEVLK